MSYGSAFALQQAVYSALQADPDVATMSEGAIFDAMPEGPVPGLYVSLGPERVRESADKSAPGAVHEFSVRIVSDGAGFGTAKSLAVAVSDALDDAPLTLARGTLVSLHFRRARARRAGDLREIELWFRARVDLGPA